MASSMWRVCVVQGICAVHLPLLKAWLPQIEMSKLHSCMRMCFTCSTCSFTMANPEEESFITQCSDVIGPGYFGAVNFGVADHPFNWVASHIFSRESIWSTKTAAQPCSPDRFYACTGAYPLGCRLSQKMKLLFLFIFLWRTTTFRSPVTPGLLM